MTDVEQKSKEDKWTIKKQLDWNEMEGRIYIVEKALGLIEGAGGNNEELQRIIDQLTEENR